MRLLIALFMSIIITVSARAQDLKPEIQLGLSNETIEISANFDGTDIVLFGSIENADRALLDAKRYDIVVVLDGPDEQVVVRRREKKFGIWVNGEAVNFSNVPSSYSVATTRPLSEIAEVDDAKILQIGLKNLNIFAENAAPESEKTLEFRESLARLKESRGLFLERIGGVEFLSPTLFKAKLALPASVPIGEHTARAFLFQDGKFVHSQFSKMQVKKIGFEAFTYNLAHQNGILYGILAVLIAIATGWLASVVFSKD